MTKEQIIRELNCCDFQDQQVLAEIGIMADGALWMQKRLIDKACKAYCDVCYNRQTGCELLCRDRVIFRKAMEEES